jgi:aryl-alcohol dehydrogenase
MLLNIGGTREDGSGTMTALDGGAMTGSFFGQSSFATHAIVEARNAVPVPAGVPLEIVGPLGCGIQTGAGTVLNSLAIEAGSSIIVSGTGAVGLSAIMAAKAAGATTIIAVDVLPERLAFATKLGATHAVNGKTDDVVAEILKATDGIGASYAVDTTAVPAVITNLINATAFGASIALVGVGKPDAQLPLALITGAGKTLVGAIEGDSVPQVFIPRLLTMYQAGAFPFDELITVYPFAEIEKAIEETKSGVAVKAVLSMV